MDPIFLPCGNNLSSFTFVEIYFLIYIVIAEFHILLNITLFLLFAIPNFHTRIWWGRKMGLSEVVFGTYMTLFSGMKLL